MRYSGIQREVLALYRQCLRAVRTKPEDARPNFHRFARYVPKEQDLMTKPFARKRAQIAAFSGGYQLTEHWDQRTQFEKNLYMSKKDFGAIEYLLRQGRKKLEMYASEGVRNVH